MMERANLYRFPWSKNDNPNGWIEITTHCNMACPGCYRGCDRKDNIQEHKPFEEIKKEIILLKKIRNCQTISISGGEPLMHPDILKIVNFIQKQKLNSFLFTNGVLLNKEFLIELKRNGLTGASIRIDSSKENEKKLNPILLNSIKERYCNLFEKVGGVVLGFTYVIDKKNLELVPLLVKWFKTNAKNSEILVLITFRQVILKKGEKIKKNSWVTIPEVCGEIGKNFPELTYAAFLGSVAEEDRIKWLYSFWVSLDGENLGYTGGKFIEITQIINHFFKRKYFYVLRKREYSPSFLSIFLLSFFEKSARKIIKNYFLAILKNPKRLLKKMHIQQILMINPPGLVDGKRDFCDACPDATFYKGKLVPSCGLEEFKRFGKPYELK